LSNPVLEAGNRRLACHFLNDWWRYLKLAERIATSKRSLRRRRLVWLSFLAHDADRKTTHDKQRGAKQENRVR
jgi:hypothetical protein